MSATVVAQGLLLCTPLRIPTLLATSLVRVFDTSHQGHCGNHTTHQKAHHWASIACPRDLSTAPHFVVYDGFKDDRACEPCSCGAPEGSFCQAWMTAYADGACSSPIVAGNVWSGGSTCHDVTPPGAAVGSKLAIAAQYNAGACKPSGGTMSGEVATTGSHTVCCLA